MAVGWVHLAAFLACQALVDPGVRSDPRHPALWVADLLVSLATIRAVAGPGLLRSSSAAAVIARVWGTFLILAFNAATMNALSGWEHDWFKPTWATLSTFGFATMAWLFGARFLIPAVQMYLTGILMVFFPRWNYLIFGVSWWVALQGIGASLILRRRTEPEQGLEREAGFRG